MLAGDHGHSPDIPLIRTWDQHSQVFPTAWVGEEEEFPSLHHNFLVSMKFSIPSEFHQFSPGSVTLANILKWESTHHWQLLHFLLLDNEAVLISSLGAY